jgi:hypothetical protein
MYCHFHLRNGIVYIPTMAKMDKGFYRGVEPVAVVSVSNTDALRQAIVETIARGNPDAPMLRRREWPAPVVLKYAGVRSWSAFERGAQFWTIEERNGRFQIAGQRLQPDGMWNDDPDRTITLPGGTPIDEVAQRMISILQKEATPSK